MLGIKPYDACGILWGEVGHFWGYVVGLDCLWLRWHHCRLIYQLIITTYKAHANFLISITLKFGWVVFTQQLLSKMCVLCKSFLFIGILLKLFLLKILYLCQLAALWMFVTCTIHIILPCLLTVIIAWIKHIIASFRYGYFTLKLCMAQI